MPNGGPDCCGNCAFNRAVQLIGHLPSEQQREEFRALSYCTLRDVPITSPFWTYCQYFRYRREFPEPDEKESIEGWIYSIGLYEGYVRIPWHGDTEPKVSVPYVCFLCGRQGDKGITIEHDNQVIGFCTNRHYVEWWKTQHYDPHIKSENLAEPEGYLNEGPHGDAES